MQNNLWPEFIEMPMHTPKMILKEQAAFFNENMKGILLAEVLSVVNQKPQILTFSFIIKAPLLGNYIVTLFDISHHMMLYPVELSYNGTTHLVQNEDELKALLSVIFNHDATKKIIHALYAQSV